MSGWGGALRADATRRVLLVVGAVLLGFGGGAVVNAVTGDGDGDSASRSREVAQVEALAVPEHVPVEELAAAIEVLETGLTTMDRQFCQNQEDRDTSDGCYGCSVAEGCGVRPPDEEHLVSYGLTLHNTSDQLLVGVPLQLTFRDAAGTAVESAYDDTEVGRLLPDETVGLGDVVNVDTIGTVSVTMEVGTPTKAVGTDYAAATGDAASLYELTVSDVELMGPQLQEADGQPPREWTVDFQLSGALPVDVTPGAEGRLLAESQVVFRDSANRIVGGGSGGAMEIDALSLGYASALVRPYGVTFPDLDPDRTAVYFTNFSLG